MDFKDKIVSLRSEKGMYQKHVAKGVGVSTTTLCRWERDLALPNNMNMHKLARFFGVSPDYLRGKEGDKEEEEKEEEIRTDGMADVWEFAKLSAEERRLALKFVRILRANLAD